LQNVSVSIGPSWNLQEIFAAKTEQLVEFSQICYLSFSTNCFFCYLFLDPPGGLSEQEKSFTLYRKPALKNRPEQALIPNPGRRFEITQFAR